MLAYERLRQHYRDLPALPGPEELADWHPENPQAIKEAICRRQCWGYVPVRVRARLGKLLAEQAEAMMRERPPVNLAARTFKERWASYPTSWTHGEKLAADLAAYEALTGPENVRFVNPNAGGPALAWDAVAGWTPELYQPLGRSIARWGRDAPLHDDPFGTWEKDERGRWRRVGQRQTWVSLGGYDPARGPWRGACTHYPISRRWLEESGPGPWQITVHAYFDGRGPVYGPLVEWPLADEQPESPGTGEADGGARTEETPAPSAGSEPNPHAELIEDVRGYLTATGRPEAYFDRWRRVLAGLGAEAHDNPMTADEAQGYVDAGWGHRWPPVVKALREREQNQ